MEYKRLDFVNNMTEFREVMRDMLSVRYNHCIYVCHPKHIFKNGQDWDDIDMEKMFRINDYKTFITIDIKNAFVYAQNRIRHDFESQKEKKGVDNAVSYVAVVERYRYEGVDNYIVRGLIRYDKEGYSVAFNPEYVEAIPKNIFDEWLQFDDDEDTKSNVYKKRR